MGQYPDTPQGRAARRSAAESRLGFLDAVISALDNRERLLAIVEQAADPDEALRAVMQEFGFTRIHAEAALDLQVRRFTNAERQRITAEREQLLQEMETARPAESP